MHFEVDRHDITRTRVRELPAEPLAPGQARIRIDAFALTANNITYAVFGDALRYWDFFPVADANDGDALWGRVPVWGFGDVVESTVAELPEGRRVYGFLPMASELVVEPGRIDERGFTDVAAHRSAMAGAYNGYRFVAADPVYDPQREAHQMLLFPLFFTSFVAEDFFADHEYFGARSIVISSASSRTAIGIAHLAAQRAGIEVVGLTSERNLAFVAGLGCYHRVLEYGQVAQLAKGPAAYVDIAGNRDVLFAVHEHFADDLRHSMTVGGTHWDHTAEHGAPTSGPRPEFLFAPAQIAKRAAEWGHAELDARMGAAWSVYADWADGWVDFRRARGGAELDRVYHEVLRGEADPTVGHIIEPG